MWIPALAPAVQLPSPALKTRKLVPSYLQRASATPEPFSLATQTNELFTLCAVPETGAGICSVVPVPLIVKFALKIKKMNGPIR